MKRDHGGYPGGDTVIDFSANINPLNLPSGVKRALISSISGMVRYPEPDSAGLISALSGYHGINGQCVAVGNGSIELIYVIPRALGARRILIVTPTFSEYERAARSQGVQTVFFSAQENDGFRVRFDRIQKYISGVDIVFLCNPNNPTGGCCSKNDLIKLAGLCGKAGAVLAVDEAFMDFIDESADESLVSAAARSRDLLVIRSMTKFFALPGLRLGYCVGHRDHICKIRDAHYPWNVNSLAQAAGEAVLKDSIYMGKSRRYVAREREYLCNGLRQIKGIKIFEPRSNFVLCKLERPAVQNAEVLNERLIKKQIFVRDCGNFRGLSNKFFRVAVRRRRDNDKLLVALRETIS